MTKKLRPMKGEALIGEPTFPCDIYPKIDGFRGLAVDGTMMSATIKPLPNRHLQALAAQLPHGLDCEITVGTPNASDVFAKTRVGCMTEDGEFDFIFNVFDQHHTPDMPHHARLAAIKEAVDSLSPDLRLICNVLKAVRVHNMRELESAEAAFIAAGYEGVIGRDPDSPYKYGKSTAKELAMWKLKRFQDAEAVIVGAVELMRNNNAATVDARGLTVRGQTKANKTAAGVLGALIVESNGMQFEVGTGFSAKQRDLLWQMRDSLVGQFITYKWFPHGTEDRPRHAVFKNFRDAIDITDY